MKNILQFVLILFFIFCFTFSSHGWNRKSRQHDLRNESINSFQSRQNFHTKSSKSYYSSHEVAQSDSGLQRPIKSKKKGFGYLLGFSTKIYHTNNPVSVDSGVLKTSAGIWENSLRNNFLLGAYDLRGASFAPILSLNFTKFNHFGNSLFKSYDFDSLSVSFAGVFQFSNNWTIRPSLAYSADFNPRDSYRRQYSQFSPSIAIGKSFAWGNVQSFLEWSSSFNFSNQPTDVPNYPTDDMDRFETALIWGLDVPMNKFSFSPYVRFALVDYSNKDKTDFLANLGLDLSYSFTDWLAVNIYSSVSTRDSSVQGMDFTRLDIGGGASVNAKF